MKLFRRDPLVIGALLVVGLLVGVVSTAAADHPDLANRYPFDPACSWGRVANGKGMFVRCLTKAESRRLAAATASGKGTARKPGEKKPDEKKADEKKPDEKKPDEKKPDEKKAPREVTVALGPVIPDTGRLPQAVRSLKKGMTKFKACMKPEDALDGKAGTVNVRFLVRSRGRAEGVSVSKRASVSSAAARCLADVVDRRFVGYPDAPMVGVTLVIKVKAAGP